MAKELPYFKFEPNEWENGNIQILSREQKGLFIDLCSMYWSRLGDLPIKLALQKLCGGNANALDLLCEENIIEVINGNICINFLNEQLSGFENKSEQNRKNAKDGWETRRKQKEESKRNATALKSQSESNAIREDEIIENEIKEDEIREYKEKPKKVFQQEVYECYYQLIELFDESTRPKNDKQQIDWLDTIEKLNRIDKLQFNDIIHLVQKVRADDFWRGNFLSLLKLRKTDKDGIPYHTVFFNKFKHAKNGKVTVEQKLAEMRANGDI